MAWAEAWWWWWWWSTVGFLEGIRESSTKMGKTMQVYIEVLVICPRNILLMVQRSCTTSDLRNPITNGKNYYITGAGFFFHQQYLGGYPPCQDGSHQKDDITRLGFRGSYINYKHSFAAIFGKGDNPRHTSYEHHGNLPTTYSQQPCAIKRKLDIK